MASDNAAAPQLAVTSTKTWLGHPLRYGTDEVGGIWFVLKDICVALDIKNSRDVKQRLMEDHSLSVVTADAQNSRGQMRKTTLVVEDLVYAFIVPKSRKPGALRFNRWVGKVIKTIRQTGSYVSGWTPQLRLEDKKADLQAIEMAIGLWPNDERMRFLAKEKMAALITNQKLLGGPKPPASVSELMKGTYTASTIMNKRISVGRMVAKKYRQVFQKEPGTTEKLVNGHACNVKVYPPQHQATIKGWVEEYLSSSE